jgi:phage terminase small subunit
VGSTWEAQNRSRTRTRTRFHHRKLSVSHDQVSFSCSCMENVYRSAVKRVRSSGQQVVNPIGGRKEHSPGVMES